MKIVKVITLILIASVTCAHASHPPLLAPHEEEAYFTNNKVTPIAGSELTKKAFSKGVSLWDECDYYNVSGNYFTAACNRSRRISAELHEFLEAHFLSCAKKASPRKYRPVSVHIVHKGIFADKRHSPKSMHSFGRAIDIKEIIVETSKGQRYGYNFERYGDGEFFKKFRRCWGKRIKRNARCPYFERDRGLTGSIGKEDEDHQKHMHLSVPACNNGKYIEPYFKR